MNRSKSDNAGLDAFSDVRLDVLQPMSVDNSLFPSFFDFFSGFEPSPCPRTVPLSHIRTCDTLFEGEAVVLACFPSGKISGKILKKPLKAAPGFAII